MKKLLLSFLLSLPILNFAAHEVSIDQVVQQINKELQALNTKFYETELDEKRRDIVDAFVNMQDYMSRNPNVKGLAVVAHWLHNVSNETEGVPNPQELKDATQRARTLVKKYLNERFFMQPLIGEKYKPLLRKLKDKKILSDAIVKAYSI